MIGKWAQNDLSWNLVQGWSLIGISGSTMRRIVNSVDFATPLAIHVEARRPIPVVN